MNQENKSRMACSTSRALGMFAVCWALGTAFAQVHAQDAEKTPQENAKDQRAQEMVGLVDAVQVFEKSGDDKATKLERVKDPVLRFNDEASPYKFRDGTLWVFTNGKRPRVLVSLERYEDTWGHELVSLAESPTVSAKTKHQWEWAPPEAGLVFERFPEQPAVEESADARLRRQKALARQFEVGEVGSIDGDDYQLRLMPTPVYTYEDAEAGVLSGGIYIFAYGTNPEVILVVEARENEKKERYWQYAFNLLTAATPAARVDGEVVWQAPDRSTLRTNTPYSHYSYPAPLLGKEDE